MFLILSKPMAELPLLFSCVLRIAETTGQLTTEATQQAVSNNAANSNTLLQWIVNFILLPALVAAGTSVITSLLIAKWEFKREKRIEGEYGHYKQLNQVLCELKEMFDDAHCDENKNPFCLLYDAEVIVGNGNCKIPFGNKEDCLAALRPICERINKLIQEQDANVNPSGVSMEEWTSWQKILSNFTKMILEKWDVGKEKTYTKIHVKKWIELEQAIKGLQQATIF